MRIGRRGLLKRAIAAVLALPLVGRALAEKAEAAPARVAVNDGDQMSGYVLSQMLKQYRAGVISYNELQKWYAEPVVLPAYWELQYPSSVLEEPSVEQRVAEARSLGYQEPDGDSGFSVVQHIDSSECKAWGEVRDALEAMPEYAALPLDTKLQWISEAQAPAEYLRRVLRYCIEVHLPPALRGGEGIG